MASDPGAKKGVARRTVLRGIATGVAGAVAAPHASAVAAGGASARQASGSENGSLRFLNEHDHALLTSLGELLVPGSTAAGVPELMDQVAAVESAEFQRALLASLRAFEGAARAQLASSWTGLNDAERIEIVRSAAAGAPSELHEHLRHLRRTVAETYFATEPGMQKLGWTTRTAWRELPRCEHDGDDHR